MKVFTAPYQGFDQPSSEDFSNPTFFQTSFADPQQYSDMDDTDIGQSGDDGGSGDIDPSNGQSTDFESFGGVNENGDAGVTGFPQNGPISWQQGSQHDGGQFDTAYVKFVSPSIERATKNDTSLQSQSIQEGASCC